MVTTTRGTGRGLKPDEEFLQQLYRGGELLAAGKVIEAKEYLERAHQLQPKNEKSQNLLGLAYFKLGLFDRAAEIYEALVRENPADASLRVNLGLVYLKTNALQRAIREFETATDLAPEHKKAQNYLGLALAQAGEYGRAREHFLLAGSEPMAEKMSKAIAEGKFEGPPPKPLAKQKGFAEVDGHEVVAERGGQQVDEGAKADAAAPAPQPAPAGDEVPIDVDEPPAQATARAPEPQEWGEQAGQEASTAAVLAQAAEASPPAEDEILLDEEAAPVAVAPPPETMKFGAQPVKAAPEPQEWGEQAGGEASTDAALAEATAVSPPAEDEILLEEAAPVAAPASPTTMRYGDSPSQAAPEARRAAPAQEAIKASLPPGKVAPSPARLPDPVRAAAPAAEVAKFAAPVVSAPEPAKPVEPAKRAAPEAAKVPPAAVAKAPEAHKPPEPAAKLPETVKITPAPVTAPEPLPAPSAHAPAEAAPPIPETISEAMPAVAQATEGEPVLQAAAVATVVAPLLAELVPQVRLFTEIPAGPFHVTHGLVTIVVRDELLCRTSGLVALSGKVELVPERKRSRGRATDKPFGEGERQVYRARGQGALSVDARGQTFTAVDLGDESGYFREDVVYAFEEPIMFENGRVPSPVPPDLDLVHLRGKGQVLLQLPGPLKSLEVRMDGPVTLPIGHLVGWHGNLTPRVVPLGAADAKGKPVRTGVELSGEGFALLALPV